MAKLTLSHVSKVYDNGKKALDDISIAARDKEFLVIVGPSGCGKTTLLRLIAGLETVTEGEILFDDEVVNKVKPKDRSVTLVFQNYALFPYMTAYENIAFGLKIAKMSKEEIDAKVMEAATVLGLRNELDAKPRELSGGQRQRVALGRAMVREPKFFLLDEPLSNLDTKLRAEMRSQIMDLYDKLDATFVYVTHDQVEAMTMGTRIAVLKDGVMQQIDTPRRIYDHPDNKFVASFLGSDMNFMFGVLKKESDGVRLTFCGERLMLPSKLFAGVDEKYLDGKKGIILGVRSEDITVTTGDDPRAVGAKITGVDVLGRDHIVYAKVGNTSVTFRTREQVRKGAKVAITFPDERMHFFSAVTEQNIMPKPGLVAL